METSKTLMNLITVKHLLSRLLLRLSWLSQTFSYLTTVYLCLYWSDYLGLSWDISLSISGYLGLFPAISSYLGLSWSFLGYFGLYLLTKKYQGASEKQEREDYRYLSLFGSFSSFRDKLYREARASKNDPD